MSDLLLEANQIRKVYKDKGESLEVLRGVDLQLRKGEMLAIMGDSGAGKSTLLHILGTLDRPTDGSLRFEGQSLSMKRDAELAEFRNKSLGFVFQFHHLLPEFTALENVMLPCRIGGTAKALAKMQAEKLLVELGLKERLKHYPSELSGGERQRVAIARAVVRKPKLLLADEPTGNLDTENTHKIQELIFNLQKQHKLSVLVVTHDKNFASQFPRTMMMQDGRFI